MNNISVGKSKLLRYWPKETRNYLISKAKTLNFSPNHSVYLQGDVPHYIYFILSGTLTELVIQEDGSEIIQAELKEGEIFGELGFVDKLPREHTIISKTKSEIIAIPRAAYISSMTSLSFEAFWDLLTIFAEKNRKSSAARPSPKTKKNIENLVIEYLFSQKKINKQNSLIKISQQTIADALGISRLNVSGALKKLEQGDVIRRNYSTIILNEEKAINYKGG